MDKERKTEFIFLCFFAYSVLGWCYEVFLEVVVYRWEFSNRGFLLGPYCPVYGFGAQLLIGLLRRFQYKKMVFCKVNLTPIFIFLMIMGITTAVELGTSYLLEAIVGKWLWDYTSYFINFEGRIALNPSLRFGIGGMLFLYVIQPLFIHIDGAVSKRTRKVLFCLCFSTMMLDFIIRIFDLCLA